MTRDVAISPASEHPVAVALADAETRLRMNNAALASLGRRAADLSATQRAAEAEAIVQEAALRAWNHRNQFDGSRDVLRWLLGYINNVTRERARQRRREPAQEPEGGSGLEALAVDPGRSVEDLVGDRLLARQLLEQLSPIDRQIAEMKCWDELTCFEIGQRLDMRENAVRVRWLRIRQQLQQKCGGAGEGQS
jgi:RNA polymerase sigma-70 factor (ECF subfamily)